MHRDESGGAAAREEIANGGERDAPASAAPADGRRQGLLRAIGGNVFVVGFASLFWLLVRSGLKPSRLRYPCQKAALANVGAMVAALPGAALFDFIRRRMAGPRPSGLRRWRRAAAAAACCALAVLGVEAGLGLAKAASWRAARGASKHGPLGVAAAAGLGAAGCASPLSSGTTPGGDTTPVDFARRVVGVHDSLASSWSGNGSPHGSFDQAVVSAMVEDGVKRLTGKATAAEAWRAIVPYAAGQTVAVKLNFNNNYADDYDADEYMNPYAELVVALVEGLAASGVPQDAIRLADPSRIVNKPFYDRVAAKCPGVRFYSYDVAGAPAGMDRLFKTEYVADD